MRGFAWARADLDDVCAPIAVDSQPQTWTARCVSPCHKRPGGIGPGFRLKASDQCAAWPQPTARAKPPGCKQQATRPPTSIPAGHRPGTSTWVRSDPGLLRYFCAVRFTAAEDVSIPPAVASRQASSQHADETSRARCAREALVGGQQVTARLLGECYIGGVVGRAFVVIFALWRDQMITRRPRSLRVAL